MVALSLGLRQSKALGLWWDDLDLDAGVLRVRRQLLRRREKGDPLVFGPLKSARSRRVLSVPAPLVELLREHQRRQDAVKARRRGGWLGDRVVFVTTNGAPVDHRNDSRAFKALCKKADLRPVRLHDLRHTAASLLLAQGQHPRVVMEVLGHSQISLTMNTYSHVMPSLLRDAADAMTDALWAADD